MPPLISFYCNFYRVFSKFIKLSTFDVNQIPKNNYSPLHVICEKGHLEVVQYLVEQGADIRANYDRVIRYASYYGHLQIVKFIESLKN